MGLCWFSLPGLISAGYLDLGSELGLTENMSSAVGEIERGRQGVIYGRSWYPVHGQGTHKNIVKHKSSGVWSAAGTVNFVYSPNVPLLFLL
jgi:hypothetical protein